MPGFDPFLLFWVLRYGAQIRSLLFISDSSTSFLDSTPSFCFWLSGIVPGFNPFFFCFSSIVPRFDIFFFTSGCSTSRPALSYLHWHCVRITHLPSIVLGFLLVLKSWPLSSVSLRDWVRGNCWSFGFWTRVHFTLASIVLRTHDSLVHSIY